MMIQRFVSVVVTFLAVMGARGTEPPIAGNSSTWNFKQEMRSALVDFVPGLLKTQDKKTGRFGTGIWIGGDQLPIYPLAVAWALNDPSNRYYHDPKLLDAIVRGGDVLVEAQDKSGRWMFRKKDNSTWGLHFDP